MIEEAKCMIILKNGRVNIISSPLIFSPIYWITVFFIICIQGVEKNETQIQNLVCQKLIKLS